MSATNDTPQEWIKRSILGKGTFGFVTLWEHKVTHEALAIKECSVKLNPRNSQRWREEIDMLSEKQHPNLVAVREVPPALLELLDTTEPCLGMEHCEGGDLRKILSRPANYTGLNEFAVLNILRDVSSAVQFLHSHKIIHRDLKPENILVSFLGNKVVYKITDLGYAKHLDQNSVADSFVGTMKYVAPEVFMSEDGYTVTADFWSMGNVLFECITGRRPFDFEMTFVKWCEKVAAKSSNDVCGSEDAGEVRFHTKIPMPYKLSSPLIPLFEEWLRLVMEWNPVTRGGRKDDNGIRMCYHVAEKIQNTKVLHVFSVNRCQLFSFKMGENDTVGSLEEKLREQFDMDAEETTLLLADGKVLHTNALLLECYNQPGDSEWLLYAINIPQVLQGKMSRLKSLLGIQNVYQQLPEGVRLLAENPDVDRTPSEIKRLWGSALFFISELAKSYRRLLQAQRAIMITLMSCNSDLMLLKDQMTAESCKLNANLEMFVQSCEYDLKLFHEMGFHKISSNKRYLEDLKSMIESAKIFEEDMVKGMAQQITIAQKELISLKNNPLVANQNTKLDETSSMAEKHLEKLLKSEQFPQEKMNSKYLVRLIREIPTIWDPLESRFYEQLRKVLNCKKSMEDLVPEIKSVVETLRGHRDTLDKMMKQKQDLTWKTLIGPAVSPSPHSSCDFESISNAVTSIIETAQVSSVDSESLIEDNEDGLERLGLLLQDFRKVTEAETEHVNAS